MKRKWHLLGFGLIGVLVLIQCIRPDHTNPPIDASRTLQARTQIPPQVEAMLQRSCNDCHSNQTVWPWYSQMSPISWYLQYHVNEGRRELNFSDWATYDQRRAARKLKETCEQVETGAMPTRTYLWLHPSAALSATDQQAICAWARGERQRLEATQQSSLEPAR